MEKELKLREQVGAMYGIYRTQRKGTKAFAEAKAAYYESLWRLTEHQHHGLEESIKGSDLGKTLDRLGEAEKTIESLKDQLRIEEENKAEELKEKDEEIEGLQAEIVQILETIGWSEEDWEHAKGHGMAPNGRLVAAL